MIVNGLRTSILYEVALNDFLWSETRKVLGDQKIVEVSVYRPGSRHGHPHGLGLPTVGHHEQVRTVSEERQTIVAQLPTDIDTVKGMLRLTLSWHDSPSDCLTIAVFLEAGKFVLGQVEAEATSLQAGIKPSDGLDPEQLDFLKILAVLLVFECFHMSLRC